jgi:hypothetical protein
VASRTRQRGRGDAACGQRGGRRDGRCGRLGVMYLRLLRGLARPGAPRDAAARRGAARLAACGSLLLRGALPVRAARGLTAPRLCGKCMRCRLFARFRRAHTMTSAAPVRRSRACRVQRRWVRRARFRRSGARERQRRRRQHLPAPRAARCCSARRGRVCARSHEAAARRGG